MEEKERKSRRRLSHTNTLHKQEEELNLLKKNEKKNHTAERRSTAQKMKFLIKDFFSK